MPLELSGVGVERDHRVGVEVVAGPEIGIPVRTGIADTPVGQVERRIVGGRHPRRSAAGLPGVAAPGFVAGLAGSGNGVEAPHFLSRARIEGRDEAADAVLAAAEADEHLVLDDERRHRDRVAKLGIAHRHVPERAAGRGIERDQVPVERAGVDDVAKDRDAAVVGAAAHARVGRHGVAVLPEHAAGLRVHRQHVVRPLGDIHDPVHDERRGLPRAEHLIGQNPLELEILDVAGLDLRQQTVALTGIAARIGEPVLRLVRGAQQAIRGDLRIERRRPDDQHQQRCEHPASCHACTLHVSPSPST